MQIIVTFPFAFFVSQPSKIFEPSWQRFHVFMSSVWPSLEKPIVFAGYFWHETDPVILSWYCHRNCLSRCIAEKGIILPQACFLIPESNYKFMLRMSVFWMGFRGLKGSSIIDMGLAWFDRNKNYFRFLLFKQDTTDVHIYQAIKFGNPWIERIKYHWCETWFDKKQKLFDFYQNKTQRWTYGISCYQVERYIFL